MTDALTAYSNVSVVAFYGAKAPAFSSWILAVQEVLVRELGSAFAPRPVREVHATILGLENPLWQPSPAAVIEMLKKLRMALDHGLMIQLGGFTAQGAYEMMSRGQPLFARSFVIDPPNCVAIGWPVDLRAGTTAPRDSLDRIRRSLRSYGFAHKYHQRPEDFDPDLYLVIGNIAGDSQEESMLESLREVESATREYIAQRPVRVGLDQSSVQVVKYSDPTLPEGSSTSVPLLALANSNSARQCLSL